MPWCEPCDQYLAPSAATRDGTCPACGEELAAGEHAPARRPLTQGIPWHFWLMLALAGVYLGWRAIDGVTRLF